MHLKTVSRSRIYHGDMFDGQEQAEWIILVYTVTETAILGLKRGQQHASFVHIEDVLLGHAGLFVIFCRTLCEPGCNLLYFIDNRLLGIGKWKYSHLKLLIWHPRLHPKGNSDRQLNN